MTEPHLIERQLLVLRDLGQLVEERVRAEAAAETGFRERTAAIEKEYQDKKQETEGRYTVDKPATEREYREAIQAIHARFSAEYAAAEKELAETRGAACDHHNATKAKADREHEEARWTTATVHEAAKTEARDKIRKIQRTRQKIDAQLEKAKGIAQDARQYLTGLGQRKVIASGKEVPSPGLSDNCTLKDLRECVAQAEALFMRLKGARLPRLGRVWIFAILFLVLAAIPFAVVLIPNPSARLTERRNLNLLAIGVGAAVVVDGALFFWVSLLARVQLRRIYRPLCRAVADAQVMARHCHNAANERHEQQRALVAASKAKREASLGRLKDKQQRRLTDLTAHRDNIIRQVEEKIPRLLAELKQRRDADVRQTEEKYRRLLAEIQQRYDTDSRRLEETHARQVQENQSRHQKDWQSLATGWHQGLAQRHTAIAEVNQESSRLFPAWSDPSWKDWSPTRTVPPAIRFGEYTVSLSEFPNGVPEDQRLRPQVPLHFSLPALLRFPQRCSVLFRAAQEGRTQAIKALQALMLRLLTSIPPGKVRFTIIDPVGLGENFAAFMHLADFDEALVGGRIWTEQQQIEQRLADMTAHMENVIQKYLRNQYQTIDDYNAQAGEVAEPYRILVVANFPVNFTAEAARRLVAIANSGAGCGVYTLISVDMKQTMPEGLNLKDLENPSVTLSWKDPRFVWKDADLGQFPLKLDLPPGGDFFNRILQIAGEKAKQANRVEVNFDFIAPTREQVWTSDSRGGIRVPLGRAGATKRQYLQLGQGTAQHALIAGKTGSGKSTLLHALITNLSLFYSPDEVQLYLIDFKKGVEFKTYASHELPHARVVAIESEREFGLSVLQRLDTELRQRGERFRDLAVQNINDYRDTSGQLCPRILLIVDEFQEFFVEDDKIAQEASLLLDRLVRQGRAFGLHVLLGSQTLGGAYSLARSTIDQMAVRIALQCSEADAYLILSKDNSAARLLSRPGEAIYNDANGLIEGNDLFQVVWLPDDRREEFLTEIRARAQQRRLMAVPPQIVFEGNAPADIGKNVQLHQLLEAPTWPTGGRSWPAWLGEAIAIKDPTAAVFRPQSSSNLMIIGQQDEAVVGIFATALVSLAAQHPPLEKGTRTVSGMDEETVRVPFSSFYVLDGTPVDNSLADYFRRFEDVIPHPLQIGGWRDLPKVMGEVAAEVDRRQKEPEATFPAIFVFIHGLHRFRDLRKQDDDFGFSRRGGGDAPASPAKQFGTILREGPGVGVFTLVWCDTLTNVNRSLDRQGMREFEMRILFQMSVADSSTLIDSPMASRLGMHRALFFSEDRGLPEKFRPYGLPSEEWLGWVRQQLQGRKEQAASAV
jgi:hypothetical protein